MRRRYRPWLPALSRIHGIAPFDIDRLTRSEFYAYMRDVQASVPREG